jgi:hypothetical protein
MPIIGLHGSIGSGKSTIAKYLVVNYNYEEYALANPLKKIGEIFYFEPNQLYGTQENKLEINEHWGVSARKFLQVVGSELFRDALPKLLPDMKLDGCSVWIKLLDIYIKKNPNKNLVISDVRFSDEAKYIQSIGGYIIKIDRKLEQPSDIAKHQSENQNVSYDIILNNNGSLDDLKKNIDTIAHVLQ